MKRQCGTNCHGSKECVRSGNFCIKLSTHIILDVNILKSPNDSLEMHSVPVNALYFAMSMRAAGVLQ